MKNLLVLNYQRYLARPDIFNKVSEGLKPKIVLVDASGKDVFHGDKTSEGIRIIDSRQAFHNKFKQGHVHLLVGRNNSHYNRSVMHSKPNGSHFLDIHELIVGFPEMVPLASYRQTHHDKIKNTRSALKERIPHFKDAPLKIDGVTITSNHGIHNWDQVIQILCDYHSSEDGSIHHTLYDPKRDVLKSVAVHLPYFVSPTDNLLDAERFTEALETTHSLIYKRNLPNLVRHTLSDLLAHVSQTTGHKGKIVVDSSLEPSKKKHSHHHHHHKHHDKPKDKADKHQTVQIKNQNLEEAIKSHSQ